ncbi:MAG: pyruvate kinase [Ignavibacteriales bacterium]|nr:pyruvate kinase [Ignavibacteriales bacterium]
MNRLKQFGKTKIVCTIGPASQDVGKLTELIAAGMDVARLNFSHGSHDQHQKVVQNVRDAAKKAGEAITILQDLSGPKIRTGVVRDKAVTLHQGQDFVFTTEELLGDETRVSTTYRALPDDVRVGDTILVDDGKIKMTVKSKNKTEVRCTVLNGGILSDKKGMNLPGVRVSAASMTEKDVEDLKFGLANDVDYVALSFVRSADDIKRLREVIIQEGKKGVKVPIVAKIEKPEAVKNIDSIIAESDVIMVARGDLGVELPPEEVPLVQKVIVRKCNEAGVPVIIATQMLESMIEVEAVHTMDRIMQKAETVMKERLGGEEGGRGYDDMFGAVARAAAVLATQLKATAIVPITHSGMTAMRLSKYRPSAPILAITGREKILRRLNLVWGVRGMIIPDLNVDSDTAFKRIQEELLKHKFVEKGDYVVFTAGIPLMSKGTTNTIKVERVE